jgi:hypothetical protein
MCIRLTSIAQGPGASEHASVSACGLPLLFAMGTASIRRGKSMMVIAILVYRTLRRLSLPIKVEHQADLA